MYCTNYLSTDIHRDYGAWTASNCDSFSPNVVDPKRRRESALPVHTDSGLCAQDQRTAGEA